MATQIEFQILKAQLTKINRNLQKDIHDLETACDFEKINVLYGASKYRHLLLKRMPAAYYHTAFGVYREKIVPLITATLEPFITSEIDKQLEFREMIMGEQYMVFYCKEYQQISGGTVLTLADPYGEKVTYPIKNFQYSREELYQRLLRVKVQTTYKDTSKYVTGISIVDLLPYKLYEYYDKYAYNNINGWAKFCEPEYTRYLSELKYRNSLADNMEEVISFIQNKKSNESYGHPDRDFIKENGYAIVQDRHSKYVLIPRNDRIDAILYEGADLSDGHIWGYESFRMQDDYINALDLGDIQLIKSY